MANGDSKQFWMRVGTFVAVGGVVLSLVGALVRVAYGQSTVSGRVTSNRKDIDRHEACIENLREADRDHEAAHKAAQAMAALMDRRLVVIEEDIKELLRRTPE